MVDCWIKRMIWEASYEKDLHVRSLGFPYRIDICITPIYNISFSVPVWVVRPFFL